MFDCFPHHIVKEIALAALLSSATDPHITGLSVFRISYVTHRSEVDKASQTGFAKSLLQQELTRQKEAKLGRVALILVGRGSHKERIWSFAGYLLLIACAKLFILKHEITLSLISVLKSR